MGYARVALTRQALNDALTAGNALPFRVVTGLPAGVEIVSARYIPTHDAVAVALRHPSFGGAWHDDIWSIEAAQIAVEKLAGGDPKTLTDAVLRELYRWDGFGQWWDTTLSAENRAGVIRAVARAIESA